LLDHTEVHHTPPELARDIAKYALSLWGAQETEIDFGDPSVGNGVFFSALLHVAGGKRIRSAIGVDINPQQVAAAKSRWEGKGLEAMRADYLHMELLKPRNLILANPPYLRHQAIKGHYKTELRQRASISLGKEVSARSGLYVYFLLLSDKWMQPNALAAWLIPSEFMQTSYGNALRYYLSRHVELIRIHQFDHDEPQFEKVHVLPAVVVFRHRVPSSRHVAQLSIGGSLNRPRYTEDVPVAELQSAARWSIPTRASRARNEQTVTVGDLFTIKRGLATGANEFFLVERAEARRRGLPKAFLKPILPKARAIPKDIIEADEDGFPSLELQLCLLDCDLPLSEVANRYPRLYEYLTVGEFAGYSDGYLVRHRSPWYSQEKRAPAPFLCTYMGRGTEKHPPLRFFWNKSDAVATNTYLMMYPREELLLALGTDSTRWKQLLLALKRTAKESLTDTLRVHAGGLYKVEPSELSQADLVDCPAWALSTVERDLFR
jgi:hypothetical protein